MKKDILGIGVLLLIGACATQKKLTERKARPVEISRTIASDMSWKPSI
jgi:hypothetical protein